MDGMTVGLTSFIVATIAVIVATIAVHRLMGLVDVGGRLPADSLRLSSRALVRIGGVLMLVMSSVPAAQSQGVDPADIAYGGQLYRQKGNCQACHGWAGDGRKMDNQMPDGANLRETTLDRQNLLVTIKCGRPGREMPAFDRLAYSDGRCFGLKQADLRARQLQMPDPPATLSQSEIESLVDFLIAKVVGKGPMDHAKCIEYWGSDVDICREFPN
jgi:Cytochrome C oxidase, cbb3-type, subunit III